MALDQATVRFHQFAVAQQLGTMTTEVTTHWYFFLGKDYRFLKLIFTILASCLIIDLFYSYFVLKPTYTSNEKRKMCVDDFPEIILCPQP